MTRPDTGDLSRGRRSPFPAREGDIVTRPDTGDRTAAVTAPRSDDVHSSRRGRAAW
ncbi:hypothetical protein OG943_17170 [Amycolatopsis sp. NBC_00345]|uniref:hypothetical protein n=1 Tax=Amycolatopsis sp. NBC_00345 TaxID=2975955 RepID=UPI002E272F08